jgi:hypothetical protein
MIALGSRDAARGRKAAREVQADTGVGASRISGGDSAWAVRRAALVVLAVPFNAAVPQPLRLSPRSCRANAPHATPVRAREACRALAGAAAGTAAAAVQRGQASARHHQRQVRRQSDREPLRRAFPANFPSPRSAPPPRPPALRMLARELHRECCPRRLTVRRGQVEVNRAVLGVDACRWAVGYKVRLLELVLNIITFHVLNALWYGCACAVPTLAPRRAVKLP